MAFSWLTRLLKTRDAGSGHELDYGNMEMLDAEALAEAGIGEAYQELLPRLRRLVPHPEAVEEVVDNDTPRYAVRFRNKEYVIFAPELNEEEWKSWGRATFVFFHIINEQLATSPYRFFAINGGNDLGGMFLTPAQAESSTEALPRKQDWPYLPTNEPPWYGQHH